MMLVAQRVRPPSGEARVNVYRFRHEPALTSDWWMRAWTAAEENLVRVSGREQIPAGGNRVESFLDVVGPDDSAATELTAWAREVLSAWPDPVGFPLCVIEGALGVRFGCDGAAPRAWRDVAMELLDALAAVEAP
jgi:hypothetical protein